jgi:hypothetical protein
VPNKYVRSPGTTGEDVLAGPTVDLQAGTYDLVASGRALAGGFVLGVRRPDGATVSSVGYSSLQSDFLTKAMWQQFTPAPTPVRPIVSSWSAYPEASAWVLWRLKIVRARTH